MGFMRAITGLALLAGLACGSGDDHSPVVVTRPTSGATVDLAVTQELHVRLPSNPSTGYAWSWTLEPEGVLASLGAADYRPDSPGVPGAGGMETFRFVAVGAGRTTLRFDHARPWEAGVPPLQQLVLHVEVRG